MLRIPCSVFTHVCVMPPLSDWLSGWLKIRVYALSTNVYYHWQRGVGGTPSPTNLARVSCTYVHESRSPILFSFTRAIYKLAVHTVTGVACMHFITTFIYFVEMRSARSIEGMSESINLSQQINNDKKNGNYTTASRPDYRLSTNKSRITLPHYPLNLMSAGCRWQFACNHCQQCKSCLFVAAIQRLGEWTK